MAYFYDMTALEAINKFVLQLFFIRLTRHQQKVITRFTLHEVSTTAHGAAVGGRGTYEIQQWWSIQYWVVPFSGWGTDYKYLGVGPKFLSLTKPKTVSNGNN